MRSLLILLIFILSACVSKEITIQPEQFVQTGLELTMAYDGVEDIVSKKFDLFTEEEQISLLEISENLGKVSDAVNEWSSSGKEFIDVDQFTVETLYRAVKENYLLAKVIIQNHYDEFSALDRIRFENFDQQAKLLDTRYNLLQSRSEAVDKVEVIGDILTMGLTVGKIVIPLIASMK